MSKLRYDIVPRSIVDISLSKRRDSRQTTTYYQMRKIITRINGPEKFII